MQGENVAAYASWALTSAESQYAQIEEELLASLFALEKFDMYVYGGQVVVLTDHKPLESIMHKPLHDAPRRLQQLLLRMQRYDVILR